MNQLPLINHYETGPQVLPAKLGKQTAGLRREPRIVHYMLTAERQTDYNTNSV